MALSINNTTTKPLSGLLPSPFASTTSATTPQTVPNATKPDPFNPLIPKPPTTPTLGSLGTTPVVSHTVTTSPDGTTTQKVTHANDTQTLSSGVTDKSAGATGGYNTGAGTPVPQQAQPTQFGGLVTNLTNTAQGNIPIGQSAAAIGAQYAPQIASALSQGANMAAGDMTTGTSVVGEGNAAVASQTASARANALAQAEQAALAGTGQQLTAQQQAQQGIGTAAGLAQPATAAYGQTVFNPITGQYEGGSGLPAETLAQYAQMAANGQISAIPAAITSNPVLSAQINAAAKAINPSYNPITSAAQGSSATDLTGQASSIQAQANGAEANFTLMENIAKQGGVNDTNVPIINTLQQNVARGLTSSDAVANFQSLIQSVRSQYASILGGGTVTVEALQEAQSLIPNDISLSALSSLGTNLKSDAANRVAGINQQISTLSGGNTQNAQSTASPWH